VDTEKPKDITVKKEAASPVKIEKTKFVSLNKCLLPDFFEEKANLNVHRLLKAEIDECFAFMNEPVTFEDNKRKAFRRMN